MLVMQQYSLNRISTGQPHCCPVAQRDSLAAAWLCNARASILSSYTTGQLYVVLLRNGTATLCTYCTVGQCDSCPVVQRDSLILPGWAKTLRLGGGGRHTNLFGYYYSPGQDGTFAGYPVPSRLLIHGTAKSRPTV